MGCDSIATTISRMGKEPTTLGPEDLKRHRFSAVLAKPSGIVNWFFLSYFWGPVLSTCREGTAWPPL